MTSAVAEKPTRRRGGGTPRAERGKRLPVVLSTEEADALLKQPNRRYRTGRRDHCLLALMLATGLRSAEVLALTIYDVNLQSGQVTVRQGKGKRDRIVWCNARVLDCVRVWRAERPASATALLFTTLKGRPMHSSALRMMVKRRGARAGLGYKDIHPHTLRHTFATELYRQCGNLITVQKALGHSNLSTTMIYLHLVDGEVERAMKGLQVL